MIHVQRVVEGVDRPELCAGQSSCCLHRDWICIRFRVALISVSFAGILYSFCTVVAAAVVAAVDAELQLPSEADVTGVAVGKNVSLSTAGHGRRGREVGSRVCRNGLELVGVVAAVDVDSNLAGCVLVQ